MSEGIRRYSVPCRPPLWARGGHAQTLASHLLPSPGRRFTRATPDAWREIELPDGDRLLVFERAGTSDVRVHLLHGLSGDVNSDYLRRTARVLEGAGHGLWAVNHRGCGEGRGLAARPYHSGRSEDLEAVLAASREEAPQLLHLVIGFSLSGNIALLHAAQGRLPAPDGIVAVNPPVDLERATVDMGRGLSRLYEMRFLWRLRRDIAERRRWGWLTADHGLGPFTSLRTFDDRFTAPECGFADGLDYYRRASSLPRLGRVTVPAVILTAADDPFVDPAAYRGAQLSAWVRLHVEPSGGHVGYLARRGPGWSWWLDDALLHYVEELARLAREAGADESA